MVRKVQRDDVVDHRTWSARRDTERPRALGSDHRALTVHTELSAVQRAALEEDLRG